MSELSTATSKQTTSPSVALVSTQIQDVETLARGLVKSGQFKNVTNITVAMARIMLGADLGMSPTQALLGIDLVKGNPQIRGVALGRMVRERANYDYDVIARDFTPGEEGAIVAIFRRDPDTGQWPLARRDTVFQTSMGDVVIFEGDRLPKGVEAFKLSQALKRGLVKDDGAWGTQPEVMCVWRALSQAVRFHAPDVIGGMPVYTEADSFHPIVTAGTGDGEPPEWEGIEPARVDQIEAVMARAREVGHVGLSDVASVRMRLNGQPREVIDRWIAESWKTMQGMPPVDEPVTDADVVPEPDPLTLTFGGETFEFADDGEPYVSIRDALRDHDDPEDEGGALEACAKMLLSSADAADEDAPGWAGHLRDMAAALHAEAGVNPDETGPEF